MRLQDFETEQARSARICQGWVYNVEQRQIDSWEEKGCNSAER